MKSTSSLFKYITSFILAMQTSFAFYSTNPYVNYQLKDNHEIKKLDYVYIDYYDMNEKKPDMVVEELTRWMMKKKHFSRKGLHFYPDYNLPRWARSYPNNYSRTGYDRGHNAANYDWAWKRKYQRETFKMSNISPQTPTLNRYLWKTIEGFSRYLAMKNEKVFVYTGSFGKKGYIKNKVVIPEYWYKLILVPKTHDAYLFLCRNKKYPKKRYGYKDIQKYLVSLKTFNNLNTDFNLKLKGKWNFKKEINKENILTKLKSKFEHLIHF